MTLDEKTINAAIALISSLTYVGFLFAAVTFAFMTNKRLKLYGQWLLNRDEVILHLVLKESRRTRQSLEEMGFRLSPELRQRFEEEKRKETLN